MKKSSESEIDFDLSQVETSRYVATMARIPRGGITIEKLNDAVSAMIEGKTDREIAILGGALLEGLLFDLLQKVVADSRFQKLSSLFEYPKPLSSFGNMNSLALAFGVISESEFHIISVLKRIRDYAAHSAGLGDEEFRFVREPVRGMLHEFNPKQAKSLVPKEKWDQTVANLDKLLELEEGRMAYRMMFCLAEINLLGRIALAERISPPEDINAEIEEAVQRPE